MGRRNKQILSMSLRGAKQILLMSSREAQRRSNLKTKQVNKQYYVYIMTNKDNRVLYTGVTNDLQRRVYEHKNKLAEGFTKEYNVIKLVYYEVCENIENAILREKQIKGGSREKKVRLVNSINEEWHDLYEKL